MKAEGLLRKELWHSETIIAILSHQVLGKAVEHFLVYIGTGDTLHKHRSRKVGSEQQLYGLLCFMLRGGPLIVDVVLLTDAFG